MFYKFIRVVARVVVFIVNGRFKIVGKENLPDKPYIVVAPHRTWWEPIFFALAISPREATFMAKIELFKNPILRFILEHSHAFPVDRKHPGPSVIKTPVKALKNKGQVLIMFPSGTRYSEDLKGGASLIAKLSKAPLVPVVYQGPVKFSDLLKHKRVTVGIGPEIDFDFKARLNEEQTQKVNDDMEKSWNAIDKEIDPNFKYIPDKSKQKPEE
ncbi:lysophospholipid acyltransferase family protein [Companilactobacillus mishanensis]|uniref:1-acyl-sn-glycerol-3-phosphate acyltransferase n=1 Tax=Companilactobacillus mishanensis TaxID=2486008 RepID=A0A5P0ZEN0_9LACO|nr:1-acyl-sn-glycerol-3-phosphate acyltransferase [Companilactobacillus mishanensis]MQS44394.1 1-acyl-sn-glycerol-3-phosphate acyltransferase [Companilactobacillus mishanensis]MQS51504.1 1-acyl-sn-glycerol-3-phosphate acyltransferase [Companilactobacillus mishanensis]MQS88635.1 1-acyl-sn-glycerol-3-phosphate acyltransferase [Companilactobacillus mishanensis]